MWPGSCRSKIQAATEIEMAQAVVAPVGCGHCLAFIHNKRGSRYFRLVRPGNTPLDSLHQLSMKTQRPIRQTEQAGVLLPLRGAQWRIISRRPHKQEISAAPLVCRLASMHALRSVTCGHVVHPTNKPVCENAQTGLSIHINALSKVDKPEHRAYVPWPYANNSFTLAEMALPSARPASFLEARPITLPISLALVAPTSAMMARSSASNSSGVRALGR